MPRKKRNKLKFDQDSVNDLVQELYDDSFTMKSKIDTLFRKWEAKVKDGGEIQAMGDTIVKIIGAMAKNQDQRLMILKYLKEIVFIDSKIEGSDASNAQPIDATELQKLADKAIQGLIKDGQM